MERIAGGFAPGGHLRAKLDGSTPFRSAQLANTVRGRSWAIHDGILDEPWDRVRMVKRLGIDAEANTAPGVRW
jgi:acetoin utilization protein AcuC